MPDDTPISRIDSQQLVALVYADWDNIKPSAAAYLNALDVNGCHELGDLVGNETPRSRCAIS